MVNTFIIADTPEDVAKLLDRLRLGKQRVECKQLISAILGESKGYSNHPAALMWKDHLDALKHYCNCMIDEWIARGYNNTMVKYDVDVKKVVMPWWFTNSQVQLSHKISLLRKNPVYYKTFESKGQEEFMKVGYIWPSKLTEQHVLDLKAGKSGLSMCAPLGTGVPAQYRIAKELVVQWLANTGVNPKTKRKITATGAVYKDYTKAAVFYDLVK